MDLLVWLEGTALATWVREAVWGYPLLLAAHAIGLGVLVGVLVLIDLRLLGAARRLPIPPLARLMPVAWGAFALNLASGIALFSADAQRFFGSTNFQIKLLLIVLAVINAALVHRYLSKEAARAGDITVASGRAKLLAGSSLALWGGAIIAGRLLAYTMVPF